MTCKPTGRMYSRSFQYRLNMSVSVRLDTFIVLSSGQNLAMYVFQIPTDTNLSYLYQTLPLSRPCWLAGP